MTRRLADVLEHPRAREARAAIARSGGLASQADLAKRWGLTRQRVHQLAREPGFPSPAGHVNGRPVWFADEADRWYAYRDLYLAEAALLAA